MRCDKERAAAEAQAEQERHTQEAERKKEKASQVAKRAAAAQYTKIVREL